MAVVAFSYGFVTAGPDPADESQQTAEQAADQATSAAMFDPASAESCVGLADMHIDLIGNALYAAGQITAEDLNGELDAELVEATEAYEAFVTDPAMDQAMELCGSGELDQLLCEQRDHLEALGSGGEELLEGALPDCEGATQG